jgi:AraC-like DNA-binding protein
MGRQRALMRFRLVPAAVAFLAERRLDPRPILDRLNLADAPRAEPLYLPLAKVRAFLDACAHLAGDPWFGWNLAARQPPGMYGSIEFVLRSASTLHAGMDALCRYGSLVNGLIRFELENRGELVGFGFSIPGEREAAGPQLNEYTLHYMLGLVRSFGGTIPAAIDLAHRRGREASRLAEIVGDDTKVRFGATTCRVWIPRELCGRTSSLSDAGLHAFVASQVVSAFTAERSGDVVRAVHDVVAAQLGKSSIEITRVARALGASSRTLQRQLHDAGTSFRDVVELVRQERARELVLVDSLSIAEIAKRVGYDDPAVFARAFRRWTGRSPRDYRNSASGKG